VVDGEGWDLRFRGLSASILGGGGGEVGSHLIVKSTGSLMRSIVVGLLESIEKSVGGVKFMRSVMLKLEM